MAEPRHIASVVAGYVTQAVAELELAAVGLALCDDRAEHELRGLRHYHMADPSCRTLFRAVESAWERGEAAPRRASRAEAGRWLEAVGKAADRNHAGAADRIRHALASFEPDTDLEQVAELVALVRWASDVRVGAGVVA